MTFSVVSISGGGYVFLIVVQVLLLKKTVYWSGDMGPEYGETFFRMAQDAANNP